MVSDMYNKSYLFGQDGTIFNTSIFLFGYCLIKREKVVIYGAGTVGQDYYSQLCQYQECKVIAWVDKNAFKYQNDYADISEPDNLGKLDYDILIIAVKDYQLAKQIEKELIKQGISESKITWSMPQYLS